MFPSWRPNAAAIGHTLVVLVVVQARFEVDWSCPEWIEDELVRCGARDAHLLDDDRVSVTVAPARARLARTSCGNSLHASARERSRSSSPRSPSSNHIGIAVRTSKSGRA